MIINENAFNIACRLNIQCLHYVHLITPLLMVHDHETQSVFGFRCNHLKMKRYNVKMRNQLKSSADYA